MRSGPPGGGRDVPEAPRRWPGVDVLEQLVHPRRIAKVDHILGQRIASVTAVFENIYDPHNVGACMRTCEGFGLQDVHVITAKHGYKTPTTITKSADQWLTSHRWETTESCVAALKDQGYALWVADLEAEETLADLPVEGKIALVVGNEAEGISAAIRDAADKRYILPMAGMVQSYNLSVALAVSLQQVVPVRRAQLGGGGDLPLDRQWQLRRRWLEHGMRNAKKVRAAYEAEAEQTKTTGSDT